MNHENICKKCPYCYWVEGEESWSCGSLEKTEENMRLTQLFHSKKEDGFEARKNCPYFLEHIMEYKNGS